jgi:palmitoyltransferase
MNDAVERPSLRQQWREHWETRDQIMKPKPQTANRMAVAFFCLMNISLMYTALGVVTVDSRANRLVKSGRFWGLPCFWVRLVIWVLFIETIFNWYLCLSKAVTEMTRVTQTRLENAAARHSLSVAQLTASFPICSTCSVAQPPRSHHCKVCNRCVLKLDHHCYFTACCVGFYNQRYFVVFTFYAAVSCAVGSLLIIVYLTHTGLSVQSWLDLFHYCPAVGLIEWLIGRMSTAHLLLTTQLTMALLSSGASLQFFIWQMYTIVHGQTTYEAKHGVNRYRRDSSTGSNLREVFGPFWLINFLWPLRTLPDGDGIVWQLQKTVKGN